MAGILKRFKDIMAANINALLDKAEDPEKMIEQYLRDMEDDLGKIKAETAAVMAEAEKALVAGNEEDARRFLAKKAELNKQRELKQQMADVAGANAQKMRDMHDKLTSDIATLHERKATIKAKVQAAKAQEHINDLSEQVGNIDITDGMSAFDKMEEKADQMLDMANARAELNSQAPGAEALDEVAKKYEDNTDIDNELAALKSQLGL